MEDIYKKSGFIIGFLILVFGVQTAFGEEASQKFVLLVLFTMVMLNADSFANVITGISTALTGKATGKEN